jgi:hypothetical protein
MAKTLTHDAVIARLKKMQKGKTLTSFAAELAISPAYLCDVYAGKRGLGGKILGRLGLVQNPLTYSEIEDDSG